MESSLRTARLIGVAAFGVLTALAAFGASSAGATTLCSQNASPCPGVEYPAGTKIEEALVAGSKVTFATNLGTVTCTGSTTAGETTTAGGEGKAVEGTVSGLTFSGCKLGETSCTMTAVNLPYSATATATEKGNGTLVVKDAEGVGTSVKCGAFVNCTVTTKEAKLAVTGGTDAVAKAETLPLENKSGIFCPTSVTWTAEYELVQPRPLFLITKVGTPHEYTTEEAFGIENPGSPNICHACAGDPVNAASGNFTESQTDLAIGGRGPSLEITRSYNSQLAATQKEGGTFGFGWTGPYSTSLTIDETAKTATVHEDNGSTSVFYLTEGKYFPGAWVQSTLVKEGESYVYTLPDQQKLEFNKSGQLTKIADRHKNALTLTYKEGLLSTVKDGAGRTLTFTYKEGKVESVKDPMGHVVKYTYESGNLATVTLPGEEVAHWKFKYDASHRLTEMTDGRGHTTKNEYDASNRVTLQTDPLERKHKFEYKETGGVKETTITEPNSSKTLEKFNAAGEPTEVTRASGTELAQTTKDEYNAVYELTKQTDANGHATTYAYDGEGNKIAEKDANENESTWLFNSTHDAIKETTPKGETTTITRNASGDPETIKRSTPGGTQETKNKYAENGDLLEATDPLGRTTKFEYDTYGDRKAEIDPEGDKTTWGYNEDGQVTSEVSPRGNEEGAVASEFESKTERDAQGRPIKETDPLGHETKDKYDADGNLEVLTNANGHATTYVYDADNERTEVKKPNGNTTKAAYDGMGQIESRTDGNGHVTKYVHNSLGELTETVDPLERKTVRTYDAAGNLKEVKDPEGRTTTYTYDAGDRLKEIKFSEEATKTVSYTYDKDGNVLTMTDGSGTTKNAYDELDRLTESENGNKEIVKYEYDLGNQITKITYPNGKAVTRGFDKAGRLEKVTDWLGKETKFAFSRDSELKSTTFPSASEDKDEYEYNRADQLTKTTMKRGTETLASVTDSLDNLGQLKSATQTGLPGAEKPEYEYDENERLKKGAGTAIEYDAANNPLKLGTATLKYDKANELEEGGGSKYAFDKLGARTKATPTTGPATTYGYDQLGRLVSLKRPEEGAVKKIEDTYAYNGNGLRTSQTVNGTTSHMAWDTAPQLPLLLYDGTTYYLYGPEGLPFEQIASETATYLHHDQQGSTRLLTSSEGKTSGTYTYTPYGAVEGHTGTGTTPLGYGGQYRSEDTGLIYLRARVYDPSTAQFMSVDPLVEETGDSYGYAAANPVNAGDPSGAILNTNLNFRVRGVMAGRGGLPYGYDAPGPPRAGGGPGPFGPGFGMFPFGPFFPGYGMPDAAGLYNFGAVGAGGQSHSAGIFGPAGSMFGMLTYGPGGYGIGGYGAAGPGGGFSRYGITTPGGRIGNYSFYGPGGVRYGSLAYRVGGGGGVGSYGFSGPFGGFTHFGGIGPGGQFGATFSWSPFGFSFSFLCIRR